MKKNLTEMVFILDRSGSMQGLEGDTIGGFNAMLEKQKLEEGEAFVSTVLFDDECSVLHDRVDIQKVASMTRRDYFVGGCTALLDAVGEARSATLPMSTSTPGKRMFPKRPSLSSPPTVWKMPAASTPTKRSRK